MQNFTPNEGNKPTLAEQTKTLLDTLLYWRIGIEQALEHGLFCYSFDDITKGVLQGNLHFYSYPDCCVIMELQTYPGYKTYHCLVACGDMQAIKDAEPQLREVAKVLQCKYLSITGRIGWIRELKKDGWDHRFSALFKEI
jgi:hypothetical protein